MTMHFEINNPDLERRIKKVAKKTGQKEESVFTGMLEEKLQSIEQYESERLEDEESIKQVTSEGRGISHNSVTNWLKSWGTEQEKECRPTIK